MANIITIRLSRHDPQPWGFRLHGGRDYKTPLSVLKVNGGSLAEKAGLVAGDNLIRINNIDVFNLTHKDAQDLIVRSGNTFDLTIERGPSTTWRPAVTPTGALPSPTSYSGPVTRTSLAHKQQNVSHIGCGYNNSARPFNAINGGGDGQVKSIVNKQYNSPVAMYSEEAIAETLSAQAEVLAGGVLGVNFKKNEKVYNAANSEVLKCLQEQESEPQEPEPHAPQNYFWTASHAIGGRRSPLPPSALKSTASGSPASTTIKHDERIGTTLQQNTLAPGASHRPSLPTTATSQSLITQSSETNQNLYQQHEFSSSQNATYEGSSSLSVVNQSKVSCDSCGIGIVGPFVRIKDRNLHIDCFRCATCGTSLKNQGYYNLNNKLYCDIHAKYAALNNPPPGTEGYFPVPIKPGTKLSASTISAALNAHHQANGGTSHLISSPASNATNYASPKPFGSCPRSPPVNAPKSPSSYPPPQQQQQQQQQHQAPSWAQPSKPAVNPYATLPRSTGQTQGRFNTFKTSSGFSNYNRGPNKGGAFGATSAPKRGRGILNKAVGPGVRIPLCGCCNTQIRGPFITALGRIWCPDHFVCINANCRRALQDIGFVEEKGDLYCEYCFEKYLAPTCSKCNAKIKGDCLNAIGRHFHPECFTCSYCGKVFGNTPFFMEDGEPYCEADWNELFTTKCFACGFPVEAGDRWVEALNHNYHSQCFNCTMCKKNLEGQSFYNKGGRPFCKNHAR